MPMPMNMMYMWFWSGNNMSFLFLKTTSSTTLQFLLGLVVMFIGIFIFEWLQIKRSQMYNGALLAELAKESR
jgi:hypothetical protein